MKRDRIRSSGIGPGVAPLVLLLITACAHRALTAPPAPLPPPAAIDEAAALESFEILQRAEFEQPVDAMIKFKLGWRHWCENRRGLAIESWKWVEQFARSEIEQFARSEIEQFARSDSPGQRLRERAQALLQAIESGNQTFLWENLSCDRVTTNLNIRK